jgi:hypothetical protein
MEQSNSDRKFLKVRCLPSRFYAAVGSYGLALTKMLRGAGAVEPALALRRAARAPVSTGKCTSTKFDSAGLRVRVTLRAAAKWFDHHFE